MAVALSIAGVTAFIVLLDCVLFRTHLPSSYVRFYTSPLMARLPPICILAIFEEIKYRLLVMTVMSICVAVILRKPPPSWCFVFIIIFAQFANVGGLVLQDPAYASLRYLAVGSVWGWLYWRHGWTSALIGHAATHLLLDPLLLVGLR